MAARPAARPAAPTAPAAPAVPYPTYPVLEPTQALLVFLFSFNITGFATIAAGVAGRKTLLWKGIFQLFLTPLFVGIVWAVVSGYRILKNAQTAA